MAAVNPTPASPAPPQVVAPVPVTTIAPSVPKKFNTPKFRKFSIDTEKIKAKLPKIGLVALGIIILIIVIALIVSYFRPKPTIFTPAEPSPTPNEEIIFLPSPYADDDEIAKIEKDIKALEVELGQINIREDTLRVPSLDWNVEFK